ncbi:MAG: hypothetical protein AUJ18_02980 [Candidatus Hydrogenedentes bacterium CG1_02_42_14]|nr:MAG: hypothetical protein AUJ18_02980 [Candidatus Hydrogenedentes bacterium CG1_02_42_14]
MIELKNKFWIFKYSFTSAIVILLVLTSASCLPGTQSTGIAVKSPSDEVLASMIRAIEERKADKFISGVDATCIPTPDSLWSKLIDFLNAAELIEFVVAVDNRSIQGSDRVTYVFSWNRKYDNKTNGTTINDSGRSEWTFVKRPGEPFTLILMSGDQLF